MSSDSNQPLRRREMLGSLSTIGLVGCIDNITTRGEPTFTSGRADWEPGSDNVPTDSWPLARRDAQRSGTNSVVTGPEPPIEFKWSVSPAQDRFNTPVVADGRIFAANKQGGMLLALDIETGEEIWRKTFEQWLSDPAVANGVLYIKDASTSIDHEPNRILAYDVATGKRKWTYELTDEEHRGTTLIVTGETVYAAADKYLLAINATTGELAWKFDPGEPHRRLFSVVIGSDLVYVSAHTTDIVNEEERTGTVFALDPVAETVEWSAEFRQASELALEKDILIVRDISTLYALDSSSGQRNWQTALRPHHSWEQHGPDPLFAIVDDTAYYQADSNKTEDGVAIKGASLTDGAERLHVNLGHPGAIERSPLVSANNKYLYAVTTVDIYTHYIDVIDLEAEEHLQTVELDHDHFRGYAGSPVLAENTLFVSDGGGGSIVAYR